MKLKHIMTALAIFACARGAYAQTAGDFTVSTGWSYFMPQSSNYIFDKSFIFDSPMINAPRAQVKASNASALSLSGAYFITDNFASEFMLSTPAQFEIKNTTSKPVYFDGTPGEVVSTVEQSSYMLLFKYYFGDANAKLRPFLGAGLSFNHFAKTRFKDGMYLLGPATLSIKNQWAPVLNGGFVYQFDQHWFAGLSASYMQLEPTAEVKSISRHSRSYAKFKLNPFITFLSIGYRL